MLNTTKLAKLIEDRRGAGMTEYIILVGVIALFCIAAFEIFGDSVTEKVNEEAGVVDSIRTS